MKCIDIEGYTNLVFLQRVVLLLLICTREENKTFSLARNQNQTINLKVTIWSIGCPVRIEEFFVLCGFCGFISL